MKLYFEYKDKVIYKGEICDFGYYHPNWPNTASAIIYEEGSSDLQSSQIVDSDDLTPATQQFRFKDSLKGKAIDHIDGNIDNNDLSNLRIINFKENVK